MPLETTPCRWQHHKDELFIALQRLLPQHSASRLLGKIADSEKPWLKDRLIRAAISHYGINLDEAENDDPAAYSSFNAFFTRHLRPGARPVDLRDNALVSPADGTLSQRGNIVDGQIYQAKGREFSTAALLGCPAEQAARFASGAFATIYLAPRDYHRVHMPVDGSLTSTTYIPGKLFSVNDTTARHIDRLFARNERLVCWFDTARGKMAVVLVGALFVAGIETQWQKYYRPETVQRQTFEPAETFAKGDELGCFRFGSTVVVISEADLDWADTAAAGTTCKMGEALGTF